MIPTDMSARSKKQSVMKHFGRGDRRRVLFALRVQRVEVTLNFDL
jgi:hypothetical protein